MILLLVGISQHPQRQNNLSPPVRVDVDSGVKMETETGALLPSAKRDPSSCGAGL
jgi:hypothetical protein